MRQKNINYILGFMVTLFFLLFLSSDSLAQGSEALPPLKIVHLGDSYSAGNGARSDWGFRNYHGVSGCYRSPTNWGSQFAESLKGTFSVTYINRACSGSIIEQITEKRDMKDSVLKQLDGTCPSGDYPGEESFEEKNAAQCSRFLEPQIDAIDEDVDLVLITIGGNNLKFDNIVKQCFVLGMRHPNDCREAVENANSFLGNPPDFEGDLKTKLIEMFAEIRMKSPDVKIVYVSYPHLLLDAEYKLVEGFATPYDAATELRALAISGDEMQRAAVAKANANAGEEYIIFYDGTKELFDGHEPDSSVLSRNPDRWIHEFETRIPAEWYHPNALGHENWGRALSPFETFGATSGSFGKDADVDIAFVVDTTGSMEDEIAQVRADLSALVDKLASTTNSYRVAVVSYRDFPERTGDPADYPFRVDQTFTNDLASIQAAIDSLSAEAGDDIPETVFSGIQAAIELPWRPGVTKTMLVIGDAPALSPEPISGLTASQIVANSIAVDPVQVTGVDVGDLDDNGALGLIADRTGGSVVSGTSELTDTIVEILDLTAKQPFAWVGQAYSGKIGEPIQFDASGSYDPSGFPISLYEWDFDGNGVFDLETTEPSATYTYDADFNDFVIVRVTSPGGTALASARTVVNPEGFVSQGDEDSCELDENGNSIIVDEDGIFIPCTADSLPEEDLAGVREISDASIPPNTPTTQGHSYYDPDSDGMGILLLLVIIVLFSVAFIFYIKNRKSPRAYLQIVGDPKSSSIISLKDNFLIGRSSMSNLCLPDTTVSRQHARFRYAKEAWFIQDLNSKGGTYVNGRRIQATSLTHGDQIRIGRTVLTFHE